MAHPRILTHWIDLPQGGAMRALAFPESGASFDLANRVAFIEKTPRVRVEPLDPQAGSSSLDDHIHWRSGPKGSNCLDPASRAWCDEQLHALGYVLPEDGLPDEAQDVGIVLLSVSLALLGERAEEAEPQDLVDALSSAVRRAQAWDDLAQMALGEGVGSDVGRDADTEALRLDQTRQVIEQKLARLAQVEAELLRVQQERAALAGALRLAGASSPWKSILEAVVREMQSRRVHGSPKEKGNAPGHAHEIPGIWDSDNGDLAGHPCAWCTTWNAAVTMLAAASPSSAVLSPESN